MIVDFHVHSRASDGTLTPRRIVRRATAFAALALTDHDNTDGLAEFQSEPGGLDKSRRVNGVEFSIETGPNLDLFHLLALGIDLSNAALRALESRILVGRRERNARILANFARIGIEIAPEDIAKYAHGEVLARPHFAQWLVKHHHAHDLVSAFRDYLLPDSPSATRCYEERWCPPREEIFRLIHQAGGICVMAHPKFLRRAWKMTGVDYGVFARELPVLKEMGLDGVEAIYKANTNEETIEFLRLTQRERLLVSAGSDFHGANKPTIAMGREVAAAVILPLMERLGLPTAQ